MDTQTKTRAEVLDEFLSEIEAYQMYQYAVPDTYLEIGMYRSNNKTLIVHTHWNPERTMLRGFDIFIPACELNNTQATFEVVKKYIES